MLTKIMPKSLRLSSRMSMLKPFRTSRFSPLKGRAISAIDSTVADVRTSGMSTSSGNDHDPMLWKFRLASRVHSCAS